MNKLSIIVPHYNSLIKLERLLKSIPDNEKIETIVIDDNSDIEESALNLTMKFPNVIFVLNDYGKGPGSARNKGLDLFNW
ncbi:glycosyltransferase family 2 protein [Photobacterium leiognathi]|uniref:glycosyltransferase family 2 protein n=1 Tax=Photobacterium leiognathi TaxID=553611 RepID=UPI0027391AC6|nr:glycosyltransferase [Photobacterium leiognathi]